MLSSILSLDNCFTTKHLASKYNAEELFTKSEDFIKMNFLHLARSSEEFLELSCDELLDLLSCDDIRVEDESQVLNAVLRWVNHELSSRHQYLQALLQSVRVHLIPDKAMKQLLGQQSQLMQDPVCKESINKLINKHEQHSAQAEDSPRPSTKLHNTLVGVGIGECRKVFCYDIEDEETFILPNLPQTQAFPEMLVLNKAVYILGGESQMNIHYDPVSSMRTFEFEVVKTSMEKHIGWMRKASFWEVRRDAAVVMHGRQIYVLGGWMSGPIGTVECYDSESENWTVVAQLTIPRSQLAAVASNTHILAVGGSTDQVVGTNVVEQFDPGNNRWRLITSMRTKRVFANVVFLHKKVYVLGGYANVFERISTCEVFDPEAQTWSEIASLPDTLSTNQSVVTLNNEIISITGSQDSVCSAAWYNSHADVWEKVKNFAVCGNIAGYRLCCLQVKKFYLQGLPRADSLHGSNHTWIATQNAAYFENLDANYSYNAAELGLALSDEDNNATDSEEEYFFL